MDPLVHPFMAGFPLGGAVEPLPEHCWAGPLAVLLCSVFLLGLLPLSGPVKATSADGLSIALRPACEHKSLNSVVTVSLKFGKSD